MTTPLAPEILSIRRTHEMLQDTMNALGTRISALEARVDRPAASVVAVAEPLPTAIAVSVPPPPLPPPTALRPPLPQAESDSGFELPPASTPPPPQQKTAQPPPRDSLELRLGQVWLVRIGIVILLTGFVFLGNYAYQEFIGRLGPAGKLSLLALAGIALGIAGWAVQRNRPDLANYGRVLAGGGVATLYYTVYASHFVEGLRVIGNPLLGGFLLLGAAGGIVWLADRIRSQTVASVGIALAYYTSAINPIGTFSLFSNLLLSAATVFLLARSRWVSLSLLSLAGTYGAFAFWRFHATGTLIGPVAAVPETFWPAVLFPACYWITFTAAVLLRTPGTFSGGVRGTFLTLNNAAFFGLSAPVIAGTYPSAFWLFPLVFGAILLAIAAAGRRISRDDSTRDGAFLTQGLLLISAAFLFKFSGFQLALLFALQSTTLVRLSSGRHFAIYQIFSGLSAVAATGAALLQAMPGREGFALLGPGVAAILVLNAWLFKHQRGLIQHPALTWRAAGFLSLATFLVWTAIAIEVPEPHRIAIFLATGLVAMALGCLIRLRELVLAGQIFTISSAIAWFARPAESWDSLPLTALAVVGAIAVIHSWRFLPGSPYPLAVRIISGALHAGLAALITLTWLTIRFDRPELAPVLGAAAIVALLYGFFTRAWPVAIASLVLTIATLSAILEILISSADWGYAAGAIALFGLQAAAAGLLGTRAPVAASGAVVQFSRVIRAITAMLTLATLCVYVPTGAQFLVMSLAAFGLLLSVAVTRSREFTFYAAGFACAALLAFCHQTLTTAGPALWNLIGFALFFAAQRMGKSRLSAAEFPAVAQVTLVSIAVFGSWITIHQAVAGLQAGFLVTVAWSLLAFVTLAAGFALRERSYRLLGLIILAAALGRIILIDVWQLETIFRILSFLVLGGVLLILGFLYNRHAEAIRKWI